MKSFLKLILWIAVLTAPLAAQSPIFYGVPRMASGSSLPATCAVGSVYFLTGVTPGQNWYGCTSTNTWTLQGGSASGSITIAGTSVALGGSTTSFPSPGPIGGTTPGTGAFTSLSATGAFTTNITGGGTQCVHVSNTGVLTGTGSDCGSGGSITLSANSVYGNPTGSTAAGTSVLLTAPSFFQNYLIGKFPSTAAPGSVAGNEPMDMVIDSTNHNVYICGAPAGTSAPACTTVSLSSWIQLATLAGTQTFSGTDTFTGTVVASGAIRTAPMIVVASVGALPAICTTGDLGFVTAATAGQQIYECSSTNVWTQQLNSGGGGGAFSGISSGTNTSAAMVVGNGATLGFSGSGTVSANNVGFGLGLSSGNIAVQTTVIPSLDQIHNNVNYCASTNGTVNYTCSLATNGRVLATLQQGQEFLLFADTASTSATTLNIDTVGVKTIVQSDCSTNIGTTIAANQFYHIAYNGTVFCIVH